MSRAGASRVAAENILPLAMIGFVALALRLYRIDDLSLWTDELFSVLHVENGLRYLWGQGFAAETTPPLYYTLLLGWTALFGESEAAVRGLSVLFGVGTLPLVYLIGRSIKGPATGLIAAALYAGAAVHVAYAQEARAYSLLVFFVALALLGFARVLRASAEGGALRRRDLLLYAAGAVGAVYAHATAVFCIAAMNLCFALWLVILRRDARTRRIGPALAPWVAVNAGVLLAVVPVLCAAAAQRNAAGLAWMPFPSVRSVAGLLKDILFAPGPGHTGLWPGVAGLAVAVAGLGWAALVHLGRRGPALIAVIGLALPLIGGALMLAVSFVRPVLLPRTALWLTIPLYLFVAAAIASLPRRRMRAGALALALGFEAIGLVAYWHVAFKDPWRDIVPAVAAAAEPDDMFVFVSAEVVPAFAYYWPGRSFDFARCRLLSAQGPSHEYLAGETGTRACHDEVTPEAIRERLRAGRSVWLVARGKRNVPLLERMEARWRPDARPSESFGLDQMRIVRLVGIR